jgi:hypothetical protein
LDSCFLNWHLVHTSITRACFPEFTFLGTRREPHSAQNSIAVISFYKKVLLANGGLTWRKLKRVCSKERGEHNFAACVSVKRSFAKRFGFITSYAFTTH